MSQLRLSERPRDEIKSLVSLIDNAVSATAGGKAMGLTAEGLTAELRDMARLHPDEFIEETGADLVRQIWETLAQTLAPQSQSAQEGLLCKMRQVRAEMAGPKPSAVEWHLAEIAAISWADHYRCMIERERLSSREDVKRLAYHDQRVDRTHKRYIRTMKALAAVRKLDLTAVQINVSGAISQRPGEHRGC